jgi:hypothetical protein
MVADLEEAWDALRAAGPLAGSRSVWKVMLLQPSAWC